MKIKVDARAYLTKEHACLSACMKECMHEAYLCECGCWVKSYYGYKSLVANLVKFSTIEIPLL